MSHDHLHGAFTASTTVSIVVWCAAAACLAAYTLGAARSGRRASRPWPLAHTASWCAGVVLVAVVTTWPRTQRGADTFTGHMVGHLLVGMVAPLLIALSTPLALAQRALPTGAARTLNRALRTPVAHVLASPLTGLVTSAGGMWLLYRTGLFDLAIRDPAVGWLVTAHVLTSGLVLTCAVLERSALGRSLGLRTAVLVAAIAAHSILAKSLYAHPIPGISAGDAHAGAVLMYYGGDAVELVMLVLLGAQWYRGAALTGDRGADVDIAGSLG